MPDLFLSQTQHEAIAFLDRCVTESQPLASLSGASGTGKTVALNVLLARRESSGDRVIRVHNFVAGPLSLHRFVAAALGVQQAAELSADELEPALRRILIESGDSEPPILAIDDAQSLLPETLRYLSLLGGLKEAGRPLFRILLVGRPGFTVRQPIDAHHTIEPLRPDDARQLANHGFAAAGVRATEPMLDEVVQQSQGNLRRLETALRAAIRDVPARDRRRLAAVTSRSPSASDRIAPRRRSSSRGNRGLRRFAVPAVLAVAVLAGGFAYHEGMLGLPGRPAPSPDQPAGPAPAAAPAAGTKGSTQTTSQPPAPAAPAQASAQSTAQSSARPGPASPAAPSVPPPAAAQSNTPTPAAQNDTPPPAAQAGPPSVGASAASPQLQAPPTPAPVPQQAETTPPAAAGTPSTPQPAPPSATASTGQQGAAPATPAPGPASAPGPAAASADPDLARYRLYNVGPCHHGICQRWSVTGLADNSRFTAAFDFGGLHLDQATAQRLRRGTLDLVVSGWVVPGSDGRKLVAAHLISVLAHHGRLRSSTTNEAGPTDAGNAANAAYQGGGTLGGADTDSQTTSEQGAGSANDPATGGGSASNDFGSGSSSDSDPGTGSSTDSNASGGSSPNTSPSGSPGSNSPSGMAPGPSGSAGSDTGGGNHTITQSPPPGYLSLPPHR